MTTILETAQELLAHGISTTPIRHDGSKAPVIKGWQEHTTTAEDLIEWFGGPSPRFHAFGIATGAISGNIEMGEIEGKVMHRLGDLSELATASGLGDLWTRLSQGWLEQSPSGGLHWFYRVTDAEVGGNIKLAVRPSTPEELALEPKAKWQTLAETRGTGGQTVAAPTPGAAHETGRPWVRLAGGPSTMPTITDDERRAFHNILSTLDERTIADPTPAYPGASQPGLLGGLNGGPSSGFEGTSPGDDFENRTSWPQILEPAGWKIIFKRGNTIYWCRPGKDQGISATTGNADDRDRLYVFSSSTEFPTFEPVTKFHAFSILHFNGRHDSAASELRKDGYGEAQHVQAPTSLAPAVKAATPSETASAECLGNVALMPSAKPDAGTLAIVPALSLALTDDSNAIALIAAHGGKIRYSSDQGRWLTWDGKRWNVEPLHGGRARELAKDVARRLPENGPEGVDKTLRHKRYSLSERGISSLLNQARTDSLITVTTNDLDSHAWELNTPAGIVNLRTGELMPADPAKLHTRMTKASPDPDADPTLWNTYLNQTFPDPEVRDYIQRLAGYSSVGEVLDHILPFAFGSGGNGKGVLFESLKSTLGSYAGSAPGGFLMAAQFQGHATELADLAGARFVICSEVNEGNKFDEEKVKRLTGGDTVKARFMRQDFFEFLPTHHLWLMGNNQPAVESGGDAFWRRLRLIPFIHSVPKADIVPDLQGILSREHGSAILNWIIAGAVEFAKNGLQEPAGVKAATQAYAEDVDTVGRFIEDACLVGPSYKAFSTKVTDIRNAYEKWCEGAGERPIMGRPFTAQLARHGVVTGRNAPRSPMGRMYGGIMLQSDQEETDPHGGDRGGY